MSGKILIIDDEYTICSVLVDILEILGYESIACENGKAGVEAFNKGNIDLVITDISMPEMNGLQVIEAIRQKNVTVPIIAMSGMHRSDSFLKMADYYTADYTIKKPFNPDELATVIKEALGK